MALGPNPETTGSLQNLAYFLSALKSLLTPLDSRGVKPLAMGITGMSEGWRNFVV